MPKVLRVQTGTVSGLHFGSSGKKNHLDASVAESYRVNPFSRREATTPSVIREIEKVQGGEQAPRNGNLALPNYVAVKPFSLKGLLNANLIVLIPILARGPDGLPSGHANLSRGLPRLEQDPLEGVSAVEMLAASFGPEVIE